MHTQGDEVHVSEEEASGGSKEGVVRWVLIIGTFLAIAGLSAVWITGSATRSDPAADNPSVDARIAEQKRGAATDTDPGYAAPTGTEDKTVVQDGLPVVKNT